MGDEMGAVPEGQKAGWGQFLSEWMGWPQRREAWWIADAHICLETRCRIDRFILR